MNHKFNGRLMTGGIFFLANSLLMGCDSADDQVSKNRMSSYDGDPSGNVMAQKQNGVMTELEEVSPGDYRIVKEYPSRRPVSL